MLYALDHETSLLAQLADGGIHRVLAVVDDPAGDVPDAVALPPDAAREEDAPIAHRPDASAHPCVAELPVLELVRFEGDVGVEAEPTGCDGPSEIVFGWEAGVGKMLGSVGVRVKPGVLRVLPWIQHNVAFGHIAQECELEAMVAVDVDRRHGEQGHRPNGP